MDMNELIKKLSISINNQHPGELPGGATSTGIACSKKEKPVPVSLFTLLLSHTHCRPYTT